ncbi:CRISPR-associated endonuclease Cas1 [Alicyclobacillus sp.]|uniref:CRISPR-associated endonuclease Cas4g/Cas1g n=1 Tax=Alicyclobacillus sp. TaxID=61169 RepID=UPI0025C6E94B|nr:CRISPR-associated endonuclease Cas1 [Alicyclobacillus sp.]MCL6517082.1 CRISPR-associated endonuclease Cas1 [Alicyclobacillus sp.]
MILLGAVPIRMLNELAYCERLYHLMHVQGLFEESVDTVEGAFQHRRAEQRQRPSDIGPDAWEEAPQSLYLGDGELGIVGKLDAVRRRDDGTWEPIESKHASAPRENETFRVGDWVLDGGAWPNDQIQLCAQGLLLRSNGFPSISGRIFYRGNRKTVRVAFTESLIELTKSVIQRAHELENEPMPLPLKQSNKCFRCSLNAICLPDETLHLLGFLGEEHPEAQRVRDIVPRRDDLATVYVSGHGSKVGKSGLELVISQADGARTTLPMKDVRHISLFGNVQMSTQLVHECLERGIFVSYLTAAGRLLGMAHPVNTKNILVRQAQFKQFDLDDIRLHLARNIVRAKILNQRTLLRRNASGIDKRILTDLKRAADRAGREEDPGALLGLEGWAAKVYLGCFPGMIKVQGAPDGETVMNGRNRRPPKDPVNALLSLSYSLLAREVYAAVAAVGLDPLLGFYHRIEPGRPALVLDLMEPFRPLIADSVVLRVLNTGEIGWKDFYIGPESCALKDPGRKAFFTAFERRMHEMVTHPVFGYRMSYRRTLELEVRLLSRYLMGELPDYRPLVTR